MTRLALMRHGVTAWNSAGRIQGRTDIPLSEQAAADLAMLQLPAPWDSAALWSSPLQRAARTAELVAGRAPQLDDRLIEMDWGDWEGQHGATLKADPGSGFRDIEQWGWDYCPPGGETPRAVAGRLRPFTDRLTGDTVVVCHIGIMRVLLAQAHGWDFKGPCPFAIKRNRLYVLWRTEKGWCADPDPVRLEARGT